MDEKKIPYIGKDIPERFRIWEYDKDGQRIYKKEYYAEKKYFSEEHYWNVFFWRGRQ